MTQLSTLIYLGEITTAQGLKGEVRVRSYTDPAATLCSYPLQMKEGAEGPQLTFVRDLKPGVIVCRVAGVNDRTGAEKLRGAALYTSRENLPALEEEATYVHDLIGLSVVDEGGERLGDVLQVLNHGAGDFFEIQAVDGDKGYTLPFHKDAIEKVDLANKQIHARRAFLISPDGKKETLA